MTALTLDAANHVIAATLAHGRTLGLKPLTVAVVDAAGSLIALQRSDTSPAIRPQVAQAKASGAVAMGVSSRKLGEMAVERPHFIAGVSGFAPHGLVPVAGGVIVIDDDGPGLPREARAQALARGRRLDETKPGSGLGLSIVSDLVAVHGGEVKLEDSPLGGLRVRLRLPGV
jgi:uncharacterized protein GlcG (DUF336 family)